MARFLTSKGTAPEAVFHTNAFGDKVEEFTTTYNGPFYAKRWTQVGTLEFVRKESDIPVEIMWQIASDDGAFPEDGPNALPGPSGPVGLILIPPFS